MSAPAMQQQMRDTPRRGASAQLLGVVVAVTLPLLGWTFMLGSRLSAVEVGAVAMRERLERAEKDASEGRAALQSIDQRLARIEGKLERR